MAQTQTVEEIAGSLTGFDEIAIATTFGKDVSDLSGTMLLRALAFITYRRDGRTDTDAKKAALNLKISEVTEFFSQEEEIFPDEPVTDSGKE